MPHPPIAIMTDFGERDPFVAIMKGVIHRIAPGTPLVDITHQIPPGDIQRGAIVLWQAVPHFPQGTIFLAVIDPGVGTDRKAIYLQNRQAIFIGPDNGVFSYISDDDSPAWELSNPALQYASSSTFHGRDIFAPAAAHAALGKKGADFGPALEGRVTLPRPLLHLEGHTLRGEILTQDRFGNLLTSLGQLSPLDGGDYRLDPWVGTFSPTKIPNGGMEIILPNGERLDLVSTFGDIQPGDCAALVGSTGLIELVSNRESAADLLSLKRGDTVTLQY